MPNDDLKYFKISYKNDIIIIEMENDLTLYYTEGLVNFLRKSISNNYYKFIFNMKNVRWIDSVGLGIIAFTIKSSLMFGKKLCIININENLIQLLIISGLYPILEIYDSEEKAIKYLNE